MDNKTTFTHGKELCLSHPPGRWWMCVSLISCYTKMNIYVVLRRKGSLTWVAEMACRELQVSVHVVLGICTIRVPRRRWWEVCKRIGTTESSCKCKQPYKWPNFFPHFTDEGRRKFGWFLFNNCFSCVRCVRLQTHIIFLSIKMMSPAGAWESGLETRKGGSSGGTSHQMSELLPSSRDRNESSRWPAGYLGVSL